MSTTASVKSSAATALLLVFGAANAQSNLQTAPSTTNAQVRKVSTEVKIRNSTISSREGEAGASLLARGAYARTRTAAVQIGEIKACGNSRVENASSKVEVDRSTITATGDVRIGNITSGCGE